MRRGPYRFRFSESRSPSATGRQTACSEQCVGFLTMLEEHLACPFTTAILGTPVQVEPWGSTTSTRSSPSVVAGGRASSFRLSISRCPHLDRLAGSGLRHTDTGRDTTSNQRRSIIPVYRGHQAVSDASRRAGERAASVTGKASHVRRCERPAEDRLGQ